VSVSLPHQVIRVNEFFRAPWLEAGIVVEWLFEAKGIRQKAKGGRHGCGVTNPQSEFRNQNGGV
jgi:hypothetical protein